MNRPCGSPSASTRKKSRRFGLGSRAISCQRRARWFAVQISLGLRPMDALRDRVAAARSGRAVRLDGVIPREVQPLVYEVNSLPDLHDLSRASGCGFASRLRTRSCWRSTQWIF
jgi:hypothetical protein